MTRLLVAIAMAAGLTVLPHAQQRSPNRGPIRVDFGALRDYVNDYDKRRVGERIIVADVPLLAGSEKYEPAGLFILQAGGDEDRVSLFTSPALAKRLGPRLRGGQVRARVTCTIIEFRGEYDVSMVAFVTKVEGLGGDGSVIWVEAGPAPSRLRYRT